MYGCVFFLYFRTIHVYETRTHSHLNILSSTSNSTFFSSVFLDNYYSFHRSLFPQVIARAQKRVAGRFSATGHCIFTIIYAALLLLRAQKIWKTPDAAHFPSSHQGCYAQKSKRMWVRRPRTFRWPAIDNLHPFPAPPHPVGLWGLSPYPVGLWGLSQPPTPILPYPGRFSEVAELWLGYTLTLASKASPGPNTLQYLRTYNIKKTERGRGWHTEQYSHPMTYNTV